MAAAITRRAACSGSLRRTFARPASLCFSSRFPATALQSWSPSAAPGPSSIVLVQGTHGGSVRWYSRTNRLLPAEEDNFDSPLARVEEWNFEEIMEQLEKNAKAKPGEKKVVFVDVREPSELEETGWIPGAINIPITTAVQSFHIPTHDFELMMGYKRPDLTTPLVIYCKAGVRARSAAGLARHAGWHSVGLYTGSWNDWAARNGPVSRDTDHYERIPEQPDAQETAIWNEPMTTEMIRDKDLQLRSAARAQAEQEEKKRVARKKVLAEIEKESVKRNKEYMESETKKSLDALEDADIDSILGGRKRGRKQSRGRG